MHPQKPCNSFHSKNVMYKTVQLQWTEPQSTTCLHRPEKVWIVRVVHVHVCVRLHVIQWRFHHVSFELLSTYSNRRLWQVLVINKLLCFSFSLIRSLIIDYYNNYYHIHVCHSINLKYLRYILNSIEIENGWTGSSATFISFFNYQLQCTFVICTYSLF